MTGELWLPGAHRDYGANAGYNAGGSTMQLAVNHYTVGSDSRSIARRGYFHILVHQDVAREGGCTQYAEIDAVTWHAGGSSGMPDANQRGPGIEYERRVIGPPGPDGISEAEPLTANQIEWGTRIAAFLATWDIPSVLYTGPRYGAGNWRGFVNHQALDRDRSDGLTGEEWARIVAPPKPTTNGGTVDMYVGWGTDDAGAMFTEKIDGGVTVVPFGGRVSPYGFYQDGYDYAASYGVPLVLMGPDEIAFARLRNWQVQHPPGA